MSSVYPRTDCLVVKTGEPVALENKPLKLACLQIECIALLLEIGQPDLEFSERAALGTIPIEAVGVASDVLPAAGSGSDERSGNDPSLSSPKRSRSFMVEAYLKRTPKSAAKTASYAAYRTIEEIYLK